MPLKAECVDATRISKRVLEREGLGSYCKVPPATMVEQVGLGVYVLPILAREAFESPARKARIPFQVMLERLEEVTEPATGFPKLLKELLTELETCGVSVTSWHPPSPMSIREVCERHPDGKQLQEVVDWFLELCRDTERMQGKPCMIKVHW
jgi:hypothetical protein